MRACQHTAGTTSISYYISGKKPAVLLLSGIHGNEREVIASVSRAMNRHKELMPDFLWIPEVSPSAVAAGTRENAEGIDVNRTFVEGAPHSETAAIMEILKPRAFEIAFSFHEDPHLAEFYLYDSGALAPSALAELRACIRACGVALFTGIDDPDDETLGHEFVEGYKPNIGADEREGPLELWLAKHAIAQRVLGVEAPGAVRQETKDAIVEAIFECLILR